MSDICNGNQACTIVMNHVIPSLGILTCLGIYIAPWKDIANIVKTQKLGNFNTLPNLMLAVNCLSWILYALLIGNYYIFVPNFMGLNFTLFYTLNVFHLADQAKRDSLRNILLAGFSFVFLGSLACFVSLVPYEFSVRKQVSGLIAVICLLAFYGSPLSGLAHVIKTKNTSSIQFGLTVANGINASLWTAYGFAIQDIFVYGPNLLGCLTVIVQLVLIVLFKNSQPSIDDEDDDEFKAGTRKNLI